MIFELRLYSVTHGRIGDVQNRFTNHLPELFARHGVKCVGAWTALSGPNSPRFVYLLAYDDFAHRESVWQSFYGDPKWLEVRAETNDGHEMVERHELYFLKPNAVWKTEPAPIAASDAIYEMVLQQIAPGQNAGANELLKSTYLPLVAELGGQTLGVFDMASGSNMPAVVLFHSWPNAEVWRRAKRAIVASSQMQGVLGEQRAKMTQPCFLRTEIDLLEQVPGFEIFPVVVPGT